MTLHVACAADARYAPYCAAMLHSLFSHNRWSPIAVHFLRAPALDESVVRRLQRMVDSLGGVIEFHSVPDSDVAGLPVMDRIPGLMWYRIFLPQLCPELDRILYLDADTLILDSLEPLWRTDLHGYVLGAVDNVLERETQQRPAQLGLPADATYFNSGVLLLNLARMRADNTTQRLAAHARSEGSRLMWPDQDTLNVVLAAQRLALHPRWNCQNSCFYFPWAAEVFGAEILREALEHPAILHFEGGDHAKPWHYLNTHPYRHAYRRTLAQTPWGEQPLEGRNFANMIVRYVPGAAAARNAGERWRRRLRSIARRAINAARALHATRPVKP